MLATIEAFTYASGATPKGYTCGTCGANGVRLYREYNTFLEQQSLRCRACVIVETGGPYYNGDSSYARPHEHQLGQSHTLILAVPTEDGETFWGYTSIPGAGIDWWNRLPKS